MVEMRTQVHGKRVSVQGCTLSTLRTYIKDKPSVLYLETDGRDAGQKTTLYKINEVASWSLEHKE